MTMCAGCGQSITNEDYIWRWRTGSKTKFVKLHTYYRLGAKVVRWHKDCSPFRKEKPA